MCELRWAILGCNRRYDNFQIYRDVTIYHDNFSMKKRKYAIHNFFAKKN